MRLSTVSATVIRDTRDKPLDAHHGMFSTVDLSITPTALWIERKFRQALRAVRLLQAGSDRSSLLTASAWAWPSPFAGSFVPTSQLFFSGGGTTLRSFPIDEAGPQRLVPFCNVLQGQSGCVNVTVPVGGKQLFILNSEIRFPLHINEGAGRRDFLRRRQCVQRNQLHNFVNNYTNTVGFGLRYATPIGPVRY